MSGELVKSTETSTGARVHSNFDNSTIQPNFKQRFSRYVEHVHLESEKTQRLLEEADTRLAEQQALHTQALQELRDQYENQMQTNRDKIEYLMETKLKNAENASQRDKDALDEALKSLATAYSRIDENNSKINLLEQINVSLHDRIRELESTLEYEQGESCKFKTEINRLNEEMALKLEEYENEIGEGDSLSLEIATYGKLLSIAEESFKVASSGNRTTVIDKSIE